MMDVKEIKGKDDDRCVFKVKKDATNSSFYKLYFNIPNLADKYADFARESFITELLQERGMENIVKMDEASLKMSDSMYNAFLAKAPDCGDKMRADKDIPYFATRALDDKMVLLGEWLSTQKGQIPAEIIQTFAIQLIYLVAKIQAKFGVQHNDLYEENIMVRPVENRKTITLPVGQDVFSVDLEPGHLEVILFDFGAATVKKTIPYSKEGNAWEMESPVALQHNNPPEVLFTNDNAEKHAESDAFMIGHVLLTLVAHNYQGNFTYTKYMGVHVHDLNKINAATIGVIGDKIPKFGIDKGSIVYSNLGITSKKDKAKLNELLFVNLVALDSMFNGYDVAKKVPAYAASVVANLYKYIDTYTPEGMMEKAAKAAGRAAGLVAPAPTPLRDYVESHFGWLKDACIQDNNQNRFSFIRKLMRFDPVERRAFGISGKSYCLTASLFHPYFAPFYKGKVNTSPSSVMPFVPPLEYAQDAAKATRIKEIERKEEQFYVDRFLDYVQAYPNDSTSTAYQRDILTTEFKNVNRLELAQMEGILKSLYPNKAFNEKDGGARLVALARLAKAKKPADQAEIDRLRKEQEAAEQERIRQEEEAKRKAEEEAQAKADADKAAADALQKQKEADEAQRKKDEETARLLQLAKDKAAADEAAKKATDEAARQAAEAEAARKAKEAAEELERLRIAKEEADRKAAEAKASDEAAKKAQEEAAKLAREKEEAEKAATALKAAEEEAKRKTAEAQKAISNLDSGDLDVIRSMKIFIDDYSAKNLKDQDRAPNDIVAKFNRAYDKLNTKTYGFNILSIQNRAGAQPGEIKKIDAGVTKYNTNNVVAFAGDVIISYYLLFRGQTTDQDKEVFVQGNPGFKKTADWVNWLNKKLGSFFNDIGLGGSSASSASESEEKQGGRGNIVPVLPAGPAPGQSVLTPTKETALTTIPLVRTALRTRFGELRKSGVAVGGSIDGVVLSRAQALIFYSKIVDMSEFDNIYYLRRVLADGKEEYLNYENLSLNKWQWMLLIATYYILMDVFEKKLSNTITNEQIKEKRDLLQDWLGIYDADGDQQNNSITTSGEFTGLFNKTYMQNLNLIDFNLGFIQSSLENIEHSSLSTKEINNDFYIPLKEYLEDIQGLEKVKSHLGLDKETFIEAGSMHGVDMNNENNQTRYLHTLSVLASACKTEFVDMEEVERCFVEWPPKAPYRHGQVNEI